MKRTKQMRLALDRNSTVKLPAEHERLLIEALAELLTAAAQETSEDQRRGSDEAEADG
jgi:hypothetical protein